MTGMQLYHTPTDSTYPPQHSPGTGSKEQSRDPRQFQPQQDWSTSNIKDKKLIYESVYLHSNTVEEEDIAKEVKDVHDCINQNMSPWLTPLYFYFPHPDRAIQQLNW